MMARCQMCYGALSSTQTASADTFSQRCFGHIQQFTRKKISHEKSFSSSLHNTTCAIVMVRIKSYSEKMGVFPGTTVPHSTNNIREAKKKLEQAFECLNRLKQREFHFHLFIVIPLKGNQG